MWGADWTVGNATYEDGGRVVVAGSLQCSMGAPAGATSGNIDVREPRPKVTETQWMRLFLPSKHRGMGFRFRGALSERTTVLECWHVVVVHGACEFTQLQCKRDRSSIGGRIAGQICGKVELVLRYASPDGGTPGTAQAGGYAVQ